MGTLTKAADQQPNRRVELANTIDQWSGAFQQSLPRAMTVDRFKRLLITAANANPDLIGCDPLSFVRAGLVCAQLGLEPNDPRGLAYLLPFKDSRRGQVVQLIIGYRGLVDLARRSGQVTSINAFAVYQGDQFAVELGMNPSIHHVPDLDGDEDPAKLTHAYAVAQVNGSPQFAVVTRKQIDKARASSRGGNSEYSPWSNWYAEMAIKTAIRRLCKLLPMTVEASAVVDAEEQDRPVTLADLGVSTMLPDADDAIDTTEAIEAGTVPGGD